MNAHIVGGGIAGLSAGIALIQCEYNTTIWEKENTLCPFASSRNAAIFRTYESDPIISKLGKKSYLHFQYLKNQGFNLLNEIGLMINPYEFDYYEKPFLKAFPKALRLKSANKTFKLPENQIFYGKYLAGNGVLDIHLIQDYLSKKFVRLGGNIQYNKEVEITKLNHNKVNEFRVKGSNEKTRLSGQDILVNAAGSWAVDLLSKAIDVLPPIIPHKRHLYFIKGNYNMESFPVIWDEQKDIYFRPETQGLIATHCDQRPTDSNDFNIDELEEENFLRSITNAFPFLRGFHISRSWACLRTFPMDNLPVIGFDKTISNLLWFSGLGGRGMSLSFSLIDYLYDHIKQRTIQDDLKNSMSPLRF